MANRTSALTAGSNNFQTTSEDVNAGNTDFHSDGVIGATANTAGVSPATGGLAVNAQGTPDRTTAVTAGYCYVSATPTSQASQRVRVKVDAQNITHSTNTSGSTRYDWIYVSVSASLAANPLVDASTTGTVVVSRSTSATTDDGTPPTYGKNLAVVTLTNAYASIVNGNIADKRVRAGSTGGLVDINGNELIKETATASAVNEITVTNAATGNAPSLTATGGDTNIDLSLAGKGTGTVQLPATVKGLIQRRQGGTAGDATWYNPGSTTVDTSAKAVFMQVGSVMGSAGGDVTVTYPVAYSQVPVVFAVVTSAGGANASCQITGITASTFAFRTHRNTDNALVAEQIAWLSVGQ